MYLLQTTDSLSVVLFLGKYLWTCGLVRATTEKVFLILQFGDSEIAVTCVF
jgi:hypothetical protein